MRIALLLIASVIGLQPETRVLGVNERDLTGDGKAEVLRVVGLARAGAEVDSEFTIDSGGTTVYRFRLAPLTRTDGFDGWFFAPGKFQQPAEFVESLRAAAPARLAEIPEVIARDRQASETRDGRAIWDEILKSPVTIFTFSPGGDAIVAIGWSGRAGRFYRLLECC